MRDAQKILGNLVGRKPQANEEYELDGIEIATDPSPTGPSSIPAAEDNKLTSRPVSSPGIKRPLHIHYVPIQAARDHLANERVFLAYIRTASALANFAVTILQLYRLKHDPAPKGKLSDYDLGIPLATAMLLIAMAITLVGTWRFFACQNAMAVRKQIVTCGRVVLVFTPVMILVGILPI